MSASPSYESAYRPGRLEYVQESTVGTPPTDPAWSFFSENIRSFEASIDPQTGSQRGLSDPDAKDAFAGTEADQITVTYDLQQKTGSGNTLIDGSGNANDAASDGLLRDADNRINNTHTIVRRKEQTSIAAGNTVNGSTSLDTRQYIVGVGCYPDGVTLTGDPNDAQPILVEITYECEKVRTYQVDQPASGTTIDVISTNANDSGTVTLEDGGANTTEDVTISANGTASSTSSFSDLDAVYIDSEQPGDITISDGTNDLMVIQGQNSYDHGEGDLGVPALGSGSHASAIDQSYERYHDDSVDRPDGTTIAEGFETTEFNVSNNVDGTSRGTTPRRALSAGNREVEISVTVFGEVERHNYVVEMMTTATDNTRWTIDGGHIQADSADVREASASEEVGDSKMMTDLTIMGHGITVSA